MRDPGHRTPLHNDDAEQAVLSACLYSKRALDTAADIVRDVDFYAERHRRLFRAMLALAASGQVVDPITLSDWFKRAHELEAVGGKEYLGFLVDAVPTDANVAFHAGLVADAARARRLLAITTDAVSALQDNTSWLDVERELGTRLVNFRADLSDDRLFDDKRAMAKAAKAYLEEEGVTGSPYGFASLDARVLPPLPGHFVLIGGASGSGKSTVARNIIRQWVQRFRNPVGWLTCEMTGAEQLTHLALMDAELSVEDYGRKRLSDDQRRAFAHAVDWWAENNNLAINEMGSVTPDRVLRIFARWRDQGITHFVIDHMHRLDYGPVRVGDELRIAVASFARRLKSFAKDRNALVLGLVQYVKMQPQDEPDDSRIRESNNILEESDSVLHIYRPLVACQMSSRGVLVPMVKANGGRYFEADAPKGAQLTHDPEYVYLKLGKQRRRLRDGLVKILFDARTGLLRDREACEAPEVV